MRPRRPAPRAVALLSALALALLLGGPTGAPALAQPSQAPFSAEQRAAIEAIVRELLLRDPRLLADAIAALQARERVEAERAQTAALADQRAALFADAADPVLGNPAGDVTLVEFVDYRCPYCRRAHEVLVETIRRDPRLRVVIKDIAVLRPDSLTGARAALAAQRQGRYAAMHAALFRIAGELSEAAVLRAAREAGLDAERLRRDMADPAILAHVRRNAALWEALRLQGTPTFVIGDTIIPGLIGQTDLERLVAGERAAASARRGSAR